MRQTIIGIFHDRENADQAIAKLRAQGFDPKDMSVRPEAEEVVDEPGTSIGDTTLTGIVTGAALGGIVGLLAGTVFPSLGVLLIGSMGTVLGLTGAVASTVSGMVAGAVAGGFLGLIIGFGLPRREAEMSQLEEGEGAIMLAVSADDDTEAYIYGIFDGANASDIRAIAQEDEIVDRPARTDAFGRMENYRFTGAKGGKTKVRKNKKTQRK
jgi:hypothetical protein